MDKNKVSSVIVKTTLFVTVAVCLLLSLMGLADLFAFQQTTETEIRISGLGLMVSTELSEKFADVSGKTIVTVFIGLFLFALNALHLLKILMKKEKTVKTVNLVVSAVCTAALIAVIIIGAIAICQSFDLINELPPYNKSYPASKDYYDYMYLQSYQSAAFSIFLPLMIASVLSAIVNVTNLVLTAKKSNLNLTEKQPLPQTDDFGNGDKPQL